MNGFKAIFKYKNSRAWFIVTVIVLALFITINVLVTTMLYDVICSVLGRGTAVYADMDDNEVAYTSDYTSKSDALTKSNALNVQFNEEGIVLLKNQNSALPLSSGAKISVFGKNSVNLVYGGSGSGGTTASSDMIDLYKALANQGISYNTKLKSFYEDTSKSGSSRPTSISMESDVLYGLRTYETPISKYTSDLKSSYGEYGDAALIVISRLGGEGFDLPRTMATDKTLSTAIEGASSVTDHYLQLDANEQDLIDYVAQQGFKKIIVVINSNSAMELGFIEDNSKIDAALWIGSPGKSGIQALAEVLDGTVNPSGHLVDTYARDFKQSPTWNNFGNNNEENGDSYLTYDKKGNLQNEVYYYVDYEEGIYVGYRYYETRGYTDGETWYNNNVVYPFGYGLSYTSFEYSIVDKSSLPTVMTKDEIEVTVQVTNTGSVAGKAVVQIYATAPYYSGQIEKASKVLCGFEKTKTLEPKETTTVTITIDPYDIASYDYLDANKNGYTCYELDAGAYTFSVSTDAHNAVETFSTNVTSTILYDTDTSTGTTIQNLFEDADDQLGTILSRTDWDSTWPQKRSTDERTVTSEFIDSLSNVNAFISAMPAVDTSEVGVDHSVIDGVDYSDIVLRDLIGADYDDPRWEALLDKISFSDMLDLFNKGDFKTIALLNIGKPETSDTDGPVGWTNFMDQTGKYDNTCSYASECLLASTWNKEVLYAMGESVGNEALVGKDGMPYTTWYAPAVNIHRSPFGGRNFEYFSEDGYLSGVMATYEIKGAMSKGVNPTIKHFALNEQETNRTSNGDISWCTEQAMREIYLKPFERAVKEAGVRGVMSSFNRIGTTWAGGDYNLLTKLLREEWGFNGLVISDFNSGTVYMNPKQMAYAGGNLNLANMDDRRWLNASSSNASDVAVLRNNTKGLLYAYANSNALNVEVLRYNLPVWLDLVIVLDCLLAVGLGVWGFFAIRSSLKKEKAKAAQPQTETTA